MSDHLDLITIHTSIKLSLNTSELLYEKGGDLPSAESGPRMRPSSFCPVTPEGQRRLYKGSRLLWLFFTSIQREKNSVLRCWWCQSIWPMKLFSLRESRSLTAVSMAEINCEEFASAQKSSEIMSAPLLCASSQRRLSE